MADLTVQVSWEDWTTEKSLLNRPEIEHVSIVVSSSFTLGEVLESLLASQPGLTESEVGGVMLEGWGSAYWTSFSYRGFDGQVYWGKPWADMRLSDLDRVWPPRVEGSWQSGQVKFSSPPQYSQGYDVDWPAWIEFWQKLRPFLEDAVLVSVLAQGVKMATTSIWGRVVKDFPAHTHRWARRGGHPYDVREILEDAARDRSEAATLLGLTDATHLEPLQFMLSPNASVFDYAKGKGIEFDSSLSAVAELQASSQLVGIKRTGWLACGCRGDCGVKGSWVRTAWGVKVMTDRPCTHLIVTPGDLPSVIEIFGGPTAS